MAYCTSLQWTTAGNTDTALRYAAERLDTIDNTTNNRPTLDMSNDMWEDAYQWIQTMAGAERWETPIVATSGTRALKSLRSIEAMRTSGLWLMATRSNNSQEIYAYAGWLLAEAEKLLKAFLAAPVAATEGGVTSTVPSAALRGPSGTWTRDATRDLSFSADRMQPRNVTAKGREL